MAPVALYLSIAIMLAPGIFAVAEWRGERHVRHRWFYSLLAGLLWPALAIGLLQLGMIAGTRRLMKGHAAEFDFAAAESGEAEPPNLSVPYVPIGRPAV